jgi:DNA-binding MarR family transcriptional regulator
MTEQRTLRLEDFLPYRLSIASNTVSEAVASGYRTLFGLNVPDWRLLAILAERNRVTQFDLGVATRMDKVTVSRAAASLVERGLIKRFPNPEDRRSKLLSLTAEGRTLYDQIAPRALAFEDAILQGLSRREVESLKTMLQRIEDMALNLEKDAVGKPL